MPVQSVLLAPSSLPNCWAYCFTLSPS
jgi:hypothetical protein